MATKRRTAHVLIVDPWIVEERGSKQFKIKEDGGAMQFSLKELKPGQWNVSGISCEGSQLRRRIAATSIEQAVRAGAALLHPREHGRQHREAERSELTIAEGLALAVSVSTGQDEHRRNLVANGMVFTDFCEEQGLAYWHQLRRLHLTSYVNSLVEKELKRKTIQHRIAVVAAAARAVVTTFPEDGYHDFTAGYRLRPDIGVSGEYDEDEGNMALTIEEVIQLLGWLEDQPRGRLVQLQVALSGLCGFRVREAVYLSWESYDNALSFATVQKEEGHRVKTRQSVRRLPLPSLVVSLINATPREEPRIMAIEAERMFIWDRKKPRLRANEFAYVAMANRLLGKWRQGLTTRVLRRTLMNMCQSNDDWNPLVVDSFCGHAPTSMMAKHYIESRKGRMVQLYRDKVVPKIDAEIDRVLKADPGRYSKLLQRTNAPAYEAEAQIVDITAVV